MVRLKLENLDKTLPRMSTILSTCLDALRDKGYSVKFENDDMHSLLIDPDRGTMPQKI